VKENIEQLVRDLPDAEGARRFFERITADDARAQRTLQRDAGLLSDALALAAWSPLLATTLTQHPDYLSWLARERTHARVRTAEEFRESLARFALTHSEIDTQVLLARFRRRELLRIYLQDLRRTTTLVETTEELSNLADAVLQYALDLAHQQLENLYGAPQCTDARGRQKASIFSIVALGKLGSRELNYASDIDLLFLYSDDGETSEKGERGSITNREFFARLAERVAHLVGKPSGEGAAYRVDLRLRPHGRDGALSASLEEALRYYRETAQAWELQTLIRARSAAGAAQLFARFAEGVRQRVYRLDATVAHSLAEVRFAKQKIDRQHGREARGFNVKLGRGGIREIEFIAQALQLAYGGRDAWLHAPHTLISLGRLADRRLISERERTQLSDAYDFLRMLEHRVQMEHGLQTHSVPEDAARRTLVALRMHFTEPGALAAFDAALSQHTANVRAAYERVFAEVEDETPGPGEASAVGGDGGRDETAEGGAGRESAGTGGEAQAGAEPHADAEASAALLAASVFAPRLGADERGDEKSAVERLARTLSERARGALNAHRSLTYLARIAASLDKSGAQIELSEENLSALTELCGSSEFFGEVLASNPSLISALCADASAVVGRDHGAILHAAIDGERSFRAELAALRRAWSRLLVEIGASDARGQIAVREANRLQTALASAAINAGLLIARREAERRYGPLAAEPRLAVLGLGRLGSGGMDYGSDLDIALVYDRAAASPLQGLTHDESYARIGELLVAALSNLTRDGYLYRVDLRLRPDGKNGAVALSSEAFVSYLSERASVWEWLAYVKLRAVAGELELGKLVEGEARQALHEAAQRAGAEALRAETRRVRERLERERAGSARRRQRILDIKYGAGGMLDVYFAARCLQLRDYVPDGDERSTGDTLRRLQRAGSLDDEDYTALDAGYALLRSLDHSLRLLVGRSTRLPSAADHPLLRDLARCAGYQSAEALMHDLTARMEAVRAAYDRITSSSGPAGDEKM
jgi:glutamate-ammonia-ligase adenylyltransferase